MPTPGELSRARIKEKGKGKDKAAESPSSRVEELLLALGRAGEDGRAESTQRLVPAGTGLSALPKKMVEKIWAEEYVDFNDLPPAKGKGRSITHALDGQVVVVQAADLVQNRKIIPDLATWCQCYSLFIAVVTQKKPERVPELMAYLSTIAKASLNYRWPSWIIYDQNFRQEAAGNPTQSWAKVDASLYAQCFTGQAARAENWCSRCQCLEHATLQCPYRPRKRAWESAFASPPAARPDQTSSSSVCIKYNRYNGDCRFGKTCRFRHVCSSCGDPHPASKCKLGGKTPSAGGV